MARTLCKGTRKDGAPCRGVALEQYDGYCLVYGAPPEPANQIGCDCLGKTPKKVTKAAKS